MRIRLKKNFHEFTVIYMLLQKSISKLFTYIHNGLINSHSSISNRKLLTLRKSGKRVNINENGRNNKLILKIETTRK